MGVCGGCGDFGGMFGEEAGQPIHMIPMMVGEKDEIGFPAMGRKRVKDRLRFGHVDNASDARDRIMGEIGVVVFQAGDRDDLKGHGNLFLSLLWFAPEWPKRGGGAMHLDVQDLRNFYYRSAMGRAAQKVVRGQVQRFWPEAAHQTVVGFGFAAPLLRPYLDEARRVIALMPGPQGVMPWPAGMANVSVLCEETLWPIETGMVDRLVMLHGLETSEQPSALLEEAWRVLGPGGKALFIVPNRAGLWSRSDATPYGYGRPYTLGQLEAQLKRHAFMPERHTAMLYQMPSARRFWRKTADVWEGIGARFSMVMAGGVLMVEATKRVHAPAGGGLAQKVRKPLSVLKPAAEPVLGRKPGRSL